MVDLRFDNRCLLPEDWREEMSAKFRQGIKELEEQRGKPYRRLRAGRVKRLATSKQESEPSGTVA